MTLRNPSCRTTVVFGFRVGLVLMLAIVLGAWPVAAQFGVTLPPSGDNQKASAIQGIGLVTVRIDYSSPDVTSPAGEDRRGKIWGELVPYGMADLGFGNGLPSPWRAGANENTVFTVSHDVLVEGEPLPAGSYGLHMIPGEEEWVVVFSRNTTSWGSFFYDPDEDALRVTVQAEKAPFREWLSYDFLDRQPTQATVALHWEELRVPWTISVPDTTKLYLASIRNELRSARGFSWQAYNAAAQYCLQNEAVTEETLDWAERAVSMPFIGQENFTTLSTKAQVLAALERDEAADETLQSALRHATATPIQIHQVGRQLLAQGRTEKAVEVFEYNAERHPNTWPVNVGLARGYSAVGQYAKALEHAKKAVEKAPDDLNRQSLQRMIELLGEGKDVN